MPLARVIINSITFSDGTKHDVPENAIVVLVGPNNSGKSVALGEISNLIRNKAQTHVVKDVSLTKVGSIADLVSDLENFRDPKSDPRNPAYNSVGFNFRRDVINVGWAANPKHINILADYFVLQLSTGARLNDCGPANTFDVLNEFPQQPIQKLLVDPDLEIAISTRFKNAFNQDLIIYRGGGSHIYLMIGTRPTPEGSEDRLSPSYLARVAKLPRLNDQGDGIRSFASLLLRTNVGDRSIVLIDEPEAFLHPPQARLIGETLASGYTNSQVLIATHSNDIIQGLLTSNANRVVVLRVVREGDINRMSYLDRDEVSRLWRDSILRYSNVLSGLFHKGVVLTEGDSDCRFYEALAYCNSEAGSQRRDILFSYTGGKHRLPVVIRALRALQVPVRAIVDFDIFSEEHPLKPIVEALGGDWNEYKDDWAQIKSAIEAKKPWLLGSAFRNEINRVLLTIDDNKAVDEASRRAISKLLRSASPWDAVKQAGLIAVPSGDATSRLQRLIKQLRSCGCFVVPNGEMESFCRSVGSHGPGWVQDVLQKEVCSDPELENARKFVNDLMGSFDIWPIEQTRPVMTGE